MEYLVLLCVLLGIASLILNITVASRLVQMGESIRKTRTQVEEINEYVFYLPEQQEQQQQRRQRAESGLVDLPYPVVRPRRYQPEE